MGRILLLNGDSTQALPLSRSLKKMGYDVDVVQYTKWGYGSSSRFVNRKFLFLEYEDLEEYHDFLLSILKEGYDTVIPCDDYGAMLLSKYKMNLADLQLIRYRTMMYLREDMISIV